MSKPKLYRILILIIVILVSSLFLPLPQGPDRPEADRADNLPVKGRETQNSLQALFIGNSLLFTNYIPVKPEDSASTEGNQEILATSIASPGVTLEWHWQNEETIREIRSKLWDIIVLQEQSGRSFEEREYYFASLKEYKDKFEKQARRTIVYSIASSYWGEKAQEELDTFNACTAKKFGWEVMPLGRVWRRLKEVSPKFTMFAVDGRHPGLGGINLAAGLFDAVIYKGQTIKIGFIPSTPPRIIFDLLFPPWQATGQELSRINTFLATLKIDELSECRGDIG